MKGKIHVLATMLVVTMLAACSHKDANAPLSYVPANTPYLATNLKPMPADMRDALLKQANEQLPAQVEEFRQLAKAQAKEGNQHSAALLNVLADEFDGRTVQQATQHMGINIRGLFAMYGLGLSPAMRVSLSDPAAFNAFIGRLEKAAGTPMETATLKGVTYRQAVFGKDVKLRFITAIEKKQAVLALLPADASPQLLGLALGTTKPKNSMQDSDKLQQLAKQNGYQPYSLAYVDFTQWPALIAGEKDPMLRALLASAPQAANKIPASCETDFARMASRMPMISGGMTNLDANNLGNRVNIDLAPDVAKAFAAIDVKLPGLGSDSSAPADLALALPIKEIRSFWNAQADAVAAKPFTCPALKDMNEGFAKLRTSLIKTAMPPLNDLRGVRVVLDSLTLPSDASSGARPKVSGHVLIGSDNPQGLLAMAQMVAAPLRNLNVSKDGTPVALPPAVLAMTGGQPVWVAMNDHVLGIAVGPGENAKLTDSMKAATSARGELASFHLSGDMYRTWLTAMVRSMDASMKQLDKVDTGKDNADGKAAMDAQAEAFHKRMQAAMDQAKHIDAINEHFHADDRGIVIDVNLKRH